MANPPIPDLLADEFHLFLNSLGIEGTKREALLLLPPQQKIHMINAQKKSVQTSGIEIAKELKNIKKPFTTSYKITDIEHCIKEMSILRMKFMTLTEEEIEKSLDKGILEDLWSLISMLSPAQWSDDVRMYIEVENTKQNKPIYRILEPVAKFFKYTLNSPAVIRRLQSNRVLFREIFSHYPSEYIFISTVILEIGVKCTEPHIDIIIEHLFEPRKKEGHLHCIPLCNIRMQGLIGEVSYNLSFNTLTEEYAKIFLRLLESFYKKGPFVGIMLDSMLRMCEVSKLLTKIEQAYPETRALVGSLIEKQEEVRSIACEIDVRSVTIETEETKKDIECIINVLSVLNRINSSRIYDVMQYIRGCVLEESVYKNKDTKKIEKERAVRQEKTQKEQYTCICKEILPRQKDIRDSLPSDQPALSSESITEPAQPAQPTEPAQPAQPAQPALSIPPIPPNRSTLSARSFPPIPPAPTSIPVTKPLMKKKEEADTVSGIEKLKIHKEAPPNPSEQIGSVENRTEKTEKKPTGFMLPPSISIRKPFSASMPSIPSIPSIPGGSSVINQGDGTSIDQNIIVKPKQRTLYMEEAALLKPLSTQVIPYEIYIRKPVGDGIWCQLDKNDLKMFTKEDFLVFEKKRSEKTAESEAVCIEEIFDKKRCKSIDIILARVKAPFDDLVEAVSDLRPELFTETLISGLLKNYPTEEELSLLQRNKPQLVPEIFYKKAIEVEGFRDKLSILHLKITLPSIQNTLIPSLNKLIEGCKIVLDKKEVHMVLKITRAIVNVLNSNGRKQGAWGIKLESFPRILENKEIVDLIRNKLAQEAVSMKKEIAVIKEVLKISTEIVEIEVQEHQKKRSFLDSRYLEKDKKKKLLEISKTLDDLQAEHKKWIDTLNKVGVFLGEKELTGPDLHILLKYIVEIFKGC